MCMNTILQFFSANNLIKKAIFEFISSAAIHNMSTIIKGHLTQCRQRKSCHVGNDATCHICSKCGNFEFTVMLIIVTIVLRQGNELLHIL